MTREAPLIVSISGIRGLVGRSLTEEVVQRFAAAFATALPAGGRMVLARDSRPSGPDFARAAAAALQEAGCQVFDLGICSTPGAKLMVLEREAQGAIIITASHNPAPWNGLKLVRDDGIFLDAEQGRQVEELFRTQQFRRAPGGRVEKIPADEVLDLHLERILAHVDAERVRRAGLRAAVDPCNGTGGLLLPALLEALGVESHFINAEPDGLFAHEPEPVPANLAQLGEAVRDHHCHIGFAIDPDADRVALVGPDGEPVGEDFTLALAVQAVTARRPGPVVTTLSTSQSVSDAALANHCPVHLTPVGEVHVVEKMLEVGAVVGGEGNGGVILTGIDPGRDAAAGTALILEALAGHTLGELLDSLPHYAIDKRKVHCPPERVASAVAALQERYPRAHVHPVVDGAKLYLEGELRCPWIHLRPSNTEPVVRIIAESESAAEAQKFCDEAEALLAGD